MHEQVQRRQAQHWPTKEESGNVSSYIKVHGRIINLGSFRDETEAARKYDEAAHQYFGKFAHTNFQEAAV